MKQLLIIPVNAYLVFELNSKNHWVNAFPGALPDMPKYEKLIWIDSNGNSASIGADFTASDEQKSYPIKIYLLQRVSHITDPTYLNELLNLF